MEILLEIFRVLCHRQQLLLKLIALRLLHRQALLLLHRERKGARERV